jgi:hypothetical protein
MRRLLLGMAAGMLTLAGFLSAPARGSAQEIPQQWTSQWEAHHQRYNNWRPQSHNKNYGAYGHRWLMGPDGYYYGNPNIVGGGYVPHTFYYPSYGNFYYYYYAR